MHNERNYTFVSPAFRRGSLTIQEARAMLRAYREEARKLGLRPTGEIYYRDGSRAGTYQCRHCGNDCAGECDAFHSGSSDF